VTTRAQLQPTLTTARLTLRPLVASDANDLQLLAGDFAVAGTTVTIPHPYPDGAAAAFIAAQADAWRDDTGATWAVTRDGGTLFGCVGLQLTARRHARARLGYWIAHAWWNQGFATEAARAVLDWAFGDGWHRVEADHLSRNPASGRVMEKLGMVHEGHLRDFYRRFDLYEDVELYAIIQES